ncbi:MAG: hypothetical protein AAB263_05360, partial [Planctomycetota bacterium]
MESEKADLCPAGTDSTPYYFPKLPTLRGDKQALSGKFCLDLSGQTWRQATFDNPTDNHIWASPQQGAIALRWKYTGSLKSCMLMQITGKLNENKQLDSNDGISVRVRNDSELTLTYGWNNGTERTFIKFINQGSFTADRWYKVIAKWNTAAKPHLSLQLDNLPAVTGDVKPGATKCVAYHHLLWGNDTNYAPEGLFL